MNGKEIERFRRIEAPFDSVLEYPAGPEMRRLSRRARQGHANKSYRPRPCSTSRIRRRVFPP